MDKIHSEIKQIQYMFQHISKVCVKVKGLEKCSCFSFFLTNIKLYYVS